MSSLAAASGADPLVDAVRCLNGGAAAEAARLLSAALRAAPNNPIALTLMGVALLETGNVDNAELHLKQALSISPGRPEILCYLAKAARLAGRAAEAVSLCRSALSTAPDYEDAVAELALASAALGAFEDAIVLQRWLITRYPRSLDRRRALATSLVQLGRLAEAEQVLREALLLAPAPGSQDTAAIRSDLGDVLKRRRAFDEALTHYAAAGAGDAGLRKRRAAVLQHLRRFDDAADELRAAVASDPLDMDAHMQLNELLYRQGRDEEFLCSYDEVADLLPDSAIPLVAKGQLLLKGGRAQEALACFDRALKRSPADPGALAGRARSLERLGHFAEATTAYERAVTVGSENAAVLVDVSSFFLRRNLFDRAEQLARRALAVNPLSQEALSLLTLCYRTLEDGREFELAGYDSLVRVFDLDSSPEIRDMDSFNRELAGYLAALHGDAREHFTQTLKGGTRLYDAVLHNGHLLVDHLQPQLDRAVAQYIREIPEGAPGAFQSRRSARFSYIGSWSSRISERGFHSNHIHSQGWISSVYYVSVPQACAREDAREGWLKFGEPTPDFGRHYAPRLFVEPKPGRLVLFPSYLWHGTTPFTGSEQRMTIAFDVAPGAQRF